MDYVHPVLSARLLSCGYLISLSFSVLRLSALNADSGWAQEQSAKGCGESARNLAVELVEREFS